MSHRTHLSSTSATMDADRIQALFNRIAPDYDRLNQLLSLQQHHVWKQMAVKWAEPSYGSVCLDVCCGSGDVARMLARRVGKAGQVIGLDFAANQLAIARQQTQASLNAALIEWVEGDALQLPFSAEHFDVVTMGYGLRNVSDIPRSLREMHRVLKPNGRLAILDMHRPDNPWLQHFQQWYLRNIVVPIAKEFGLKQEYAYISSSLAQFPVGREQVQLARQAGFSTSTHYAIAGGMMGILVARKSG